MLSLADVRCSFGSALFRIFRPIAVRPVYYTFLINFYFDYNVHSSLYCILELDGGRALSAHKKVVGSACRTQPLIRSDATPLPPLQPLLYQALPLLDDP